MGLLDTAQAIVRSNVEDVFQSQYTKDLNSYKKALGTGFKTNLFVVYFEFLNTDFLLNLIRMNNIIPQFIDYNLSHMYGWKGLVNGFQIPKIELETTEEVYKFQTFAKNLTKGTLSVDYINDQWNINYSFWRNYVAEICNGIRLKYPSEYMFNTYLEIYSTQHDKFQTYIFRKCFVTGTPDVDFTYGKSELHEFTLDISYRDYEIIAEKVDFGSIPFMLDNVYLKEIVFMLKEKGKYLINESILQDIMKKEMSGASTQIAEHISEEKDKWAVIK